MAGDFTFIGLTDPLLQFGDHIVAFDIDDRTAMITHEMRMRIDTTVEMFVTLNYTATDRGTFLFENGQIAVHGAKAQIRNFGLQTLVDPFGIRMNIRSAQQCEDRLALFAVLMYGLHRIPLYQINNKNCYYNIILISICKGLFFIFDIYFSHDE